MPGKPRYSGKNIGNLTGLKWRPPQSKPRFMVGEATTKGVKCNKLAKPELGSRLKPTVMKRY